MSRTGTKQRHLYTLCWNDKRMLPHFFRHYSPLVDRFFIFDNGSTDGSVETLAGDERVRLSHFRTHSESFADTELQLSEEIWKNSRGSADWVLFVDMDEHLYHEDLPSYLRLCQERSVTAIKALGYEMVADTFPDTTQRLCDIVTHGVRYPDYDKLVLFDPSAITRTNFAHGRHFASPEGRVEWPALAEVLLLHFKKLGLEYEVFRSAELRTGLGSRDIEMGAGYQYLLSPDEIAERFKQAVQIARPIPRTLRETWEEEAVRLKNQVAACEREIGHLRTVVQQHDAETAGWQERIASADTEAARIRDDMVSREKQISDLEAQVIALSAELTTARHTASVNENILTSTQDALMEAKGELSRASQELQTVYQSRSWRVTQPLRSLRYHLIHSLSHARPLRRKPSPANPMRKRSKDAPPHPEITATSAVAGAALGAPDCDPPSPAVDCICNETEAARVKLGTQVQHELESAMRSDPSNWALRKEYFGVLEEMSRRHLGVFYANLPDVATPLMIRASTSDIWNLRQIFLDGDCESEPYLYGDYSFTMPRPRRILDLGAYCGYSAVYFANRFPEAEIVCVEPPGANFDALCVNTSVYSNIRRLAAAVWTERTTMHRSEHVLGDWGNQFAPSDCGVGDTIPAYSISDILDMHGWDHVDLVKCVIEGAQVDALTQPQRPWANQVLLVATKPPKGIWPRPEDEDRLLAAFPDAVFEQIRNPNLILAFRRRPSASVVRPGTKTDLPLVPSSPGLRRVELANISDRFDFYKFDDAGLCLKPNPPGEPPASVTWHLNLDQHNGFLATVASGLSPSSSSHLAIRLIISDPISGAIRANEKLCVASAKEQSWIVHFPSLSGAHDITLSAEPGALDAQGGQIPWIHIIEARFV
jgi:FkbM family methyltransferase